jgi:hypothetical protein
MTEAQEQEALIKRAQYHPITREYLYAIPNDGIRTPQQGARFKRRGLRPGVSDVFLSYPYNGYHGLYIELKRRDKNAKPTKEQAEWIEKVSKVGYAAHVARGWEEAWQQIEEYLK